VEILAGFSFNEKVGKEIGEKIKEKFGKSGVIEHFKSFFRFGIYEDL
jgi:hypothetical protein